MTHILRSKLTKKVVLLIALIATFAYLRTPGQMQAQQTCLEQCQTTFTACVNACKGKETCIEACTSAFTACTENCLR